MQLILSCWQLQREEYSHQNKADTPDSNANEVEYIAIDEVYARLNKPCMRKRLQIGPIDTLRYNPGMVGMSDES